MALLNKDQHFELIERTDQPHQGHVFTVASENII